MESVAVADDDALRIARAAVGAPPSRPGEQRRGAVLDGEDVLREREDLRHVTSYRCGRHWLNIVGVLALFIGLLRRCRMPSQLYLRGASEEAHQEADEPRNDGVNERDPSRDAREPPDEAPEGNGDASNHDGLSIREALGLLAFRANPIYLSHGAPGTSG